MSVIQVFSDDDKVQIATLKDGDVFGERSLLYNEVRNATVKSVTFTELLVLSKVQLSLSLSFTHTHTLTHSLIYTHILYSIQGDFYTIAKAYPQLFEAISIEV